MTSYQRYKVHLAYDGTAYFGWQSQKCSKETPTVQTCFNQALHELTQLKLSTQGSGRTDRGAHARDQVVHFDLPVEKKPRWDWVRGLNRYLPEDIRVQSAHPVSSDFHALKSANSKTYTYHFQDGPAADPLSLKYSHWVSSPLDLDYLNQLSQIFVGEHDFKSFQNTGTDLAHTVRTLYEFHWSRSQKNHVQVSVRGNGFLKQMVRNLVGTLTHQYWKKPLDTKTLKAILESKKRQNAYETAPAKGLILEKVHYDPKFSPLRQTQLDKSHEKT